MDPKVFASQPRRIGGSGKVSILNPYYLDPEYDITCCSDLKATLTGWVTLIKIIPKNETLPSFIIRWDSNSETVDADIYLNDENRKDLWSQPGYNGHHSTQIKGPWRKFEISITIPERKIFLGTVNIGLLIEVDLKLEVELTDAAQIILKSNLPRSSFFKK